MVSPRVVSLIPSATEIVCALGFKANLIGRSHECDFPRDVMRLPVCTAPRIETAGSSTEIDRQIKETVRQALSVYLVDETLLADLRPDVIVTQSQCEVCAVSLKDVEEVVGAWTGTLPRIVSLEPETLDDVWSDIRKVAAALGAPEKGKRLTGGLSSRISKVADRAAAIDRRPTVACIEWIDPLMAAGNWVPEMIAMAGGRNLFGEAGKHSPWMHWDEFVVANPDVILVMPCGYDIAKTRSEMAALTERPEWRRLTAVRSDRVYLTNGNQYFNRPGPRLVESLEIIAETLHPDKFRFGHEGTGWIRFEHHAV
ncbi:MAG: cobalamin-binding protein [Phycisphaerales bacterium]